MRAMKWGIGILAIILAVVMSWYLMIPKIDDNAPPSLTKIDSSTTLDLTRKFSGRFQKLDEKTGQLTLIGNNNRKYNFAVPMTMIENRDDDLSSLQRNQLIEIKWSDVRSIEEILANYIASPGDTLNPAGGAFVITKL